MKDQTVFDKAEAAAIWCEHATTHAHNNAGKPWSYVLIRRHITEAMTIQGLVAGYTYHSRKHTATKLA